MTTELQTPPEASETTFFSFDRPLSAEAERTLNLLMARYTDGEGQPLVRFETEGLVTLRIPRTIRPNYLNGQPFVESKQQA